MKTGAFTQRSRIRKRPKKAALPDCLGRLLASCSDDLLRNRQINEIVIPVLRGLHCLLDVAVGVLPGDSLGSDHAELAAGRHEFHTQATLLGSHSSVPFDLGLVSFAPLFVPIAADLHPYDEHGKQPSYDVRHASLLCSSFQTATHVVGFAVCYFGRLFYLSARRRLRVFVHLPAHILSRM